MRVYSDIYQQVHTATSGLNSNVGLLKSGLEMLHPDQFDSKDIYGDVYCSESIASNALHPTWGGIVPAAYIDMGSYKLNIYNSKNIPVKKLGNPIPALAIIILEGNLLREEELLLYIKKNSSQYSIMIILDYMSDERGARVLRYDMFGSLTIIDMAKNTTEDLHLILDGSIPQAIREKLWQRSMLNTIHPLLNIATETVQNEQYLSTVHKNVVTQMGTIVRKEEGQANINDTMNQIKSQLQYWNTDAEKTIKLKYDDLNKANTGRYSDHIKQWSEELRNLKRTELAEKTEKLEATIEEDFQNEYESRIRQEVQSDFANDYNLITSSADSTLGKLNYLLIEKGIAPKESTPLQIDYSRFPNPENTLRSYMGFNRVYTGEVVKEGAMEYFIALKEYTGSMMVAIGLLAPLNMLASASSAEAQQQGGKETLLSAIAEVFKQLRIGIQALSAIVILTMIVWGFYDLKKRIPRKRKEELDRELRKAKDILLSEGRRMYSDASKDWSNTVSVWMREVNSQLQIQLEKAAREYTQSQQTRLNEDKLKVERQKQGIDNMVNRITASEKVLADAQRSHRTAVTDLEKEFKAVTA